MTEREILVLIAGWVLFSALAIIIYVYMTRIEPEGKHHRGRERKWESRDGSGHGATRSTGTPGAAAAIPAGTPEKTPTGPGRRPWMVTVPGRQWPVSRVMVPAPVMIATRMAAADPHARVNPSAERLATTGELRALAYAGDLDTIRSEIAAYRAVAQLEEWVYD